MTQQHDRDQRPALITGGAGFVGINLAHRLLETGRPVLLFDNLARAGVERNLRRLRAAFAGDPRLQVFTGDVRDEAALAEAVEQAGAVFHFAAQVAVTTSLVSPKDDFFVNALGTLNLLEALRALPQPPPLLFTSTNKVYGDLADVPLCLRGGDRYEPSDEILRARGIGEDRPLDFHSPYGCSKGAADQYVLDYARTFGLPAIVFRMSCIYGPHQCGNEDQGWVAHFLLRALENKPITLYGDGRQVRDTLFVDDLVDAFLLAEKHVSRLSGQAFNIGGGPNTTTSLLELVERIGDLTGEPPRVTFDNWRPGDQRYYVSDTRKFTAATGWTPRVNVSAGVARLYDWLRQLKTEEAAPFAEVTGAGRAVRRVAAAAQRA